MAFHPGTKPPVPALLPAAVLVLALGILGLTVGAGYAHLRSALLAQMKDRDGELLNAVALSEQFGLQGTNLTEQLKDPAEQLGLTLKISRIRDGVLGVRLFGAHGEFITAFPPNVTSATLDPETFAGLRQLHPVTRYDPAARFASLLMTGPAAGEDTNALPLLEVNIPLHAPGGTELLAGAQLLLDAHDFAAQSAGIERHLRLQALGLFGVGGTLLTLTLFWAWRRLRNADRVIEERTTSLLQANHELLLAAKTSALGAVTAHLIHGLSNPLANLQDFVKTQGREDANGGWNDAIRATERMRRLVQEVVRVLGEEGETSTYKISLAELVRVLDGRVQPPAREWKVRCEVTSATEGLISNHPANIILLILENLIHNAIEVTPPGKCVRVRLEDSPAGVVCRVTDEGPGFPGHMVKNIFAPCRSTKGGAGLGLAISKQLASHLGARLELKHSAEGGSVIELLLPRTLFTERTAAPPPVPAT